MDITRESIKDSPTVYGQTASLLRLPLDMGIKRTSDPVDTVQEFRSLMAPDSPRNTTPNGNLPFICEGMVTYLGVRYAVSLWRDDDGGIVTVARAINRDGTKRLVTYRPVIEDLRDALLEDAVFEAVYEAIDGRDLDDAQLNDLISQTRDMVETGDCTPANAARIVVGNARLYRRPEDDEGRLIDLAYDRLVDMQLLTDRG